MTVPQTSVDPTTERQAKAGTASCCAPLRRAGAAALGGGLPGAAAMAGQVLGLMWLRTTANYQIRAGVSASTALRTLYAQGGVPRFYQGLPLALLQAPLCRFGDTAANAGILALTEELQGTRALPLGIKTAAASLVAGAWRLLLLPLDAAKTMMQVEGPTGLRTLSTKVVTHGPGVMYHGAAAAVATSITGHWPWFATYNYLSAALPQSESLSGRMLRTAVIGFSASAAADVTSNAARVMKTLRQTAHDTSSYSTQLRLLLASDGLIGFTRGLGTRMVANSLQSVLFTMLWQTGQDTYLSASKRRSEQTGRTS